MQVLIADDESVSRRMLAKKLEEWQYEVVSACDGTEASRVLAQDGAPQLAILDWMMPGMTGPEVCAQVRARAQEPYTYIVLLTSRGEKRDLIEGMEAGADDYLAKPFLDQELRVRLRAGLRILELQAQLVTAREELREQATHDVLTGMWNRHSILEILTRELNRAVREKTGLAVIMTDLDYFKRVNDTYGHLAGDAVLREVAHRLQSSLRQYDAVGRYGGEEFLIVLPGSAESSAMHLAERLRAAVSADTISFPEGSVRVSTSVGVTAWSGGAVPTPLMLIGAADEALFQAKAAGRNRVACKNLLVTPTEVPIG